MRPMFQILTLETFSALIYTFGNCLMEFAFVLVSVYLALSVQSNVLDNATERSQSSCSSSHAALITGLVCSAQDGRTITPLRPQFLFVFLVYARLLRDGWLDNLQWLNSNGAAALVGCARVKVNITQS
ncbi:hypothetical protein RRG08_008576 [Elysia crispata]|uniref:Uncharacterized protein n=1 Tax=Elysia crispata TaxID=231223 RepID=A0AAE1CRA5_9GAST|nr:hypothetical protein RRG08_008576 [Elysia crispata]